MSKPCIIIVGKYGKNYISEEICIPNEKNSYNYFPSITEEIDNAQIFPTFEDANKYLHHYGIVGEILIVENATIHNLVVCSEWANALPIYSKNVKQDEVYFILGNFGLNREDADWYSTDNGCCNIYDAAKILSAYPVLEMAYKNSAFDDAKNKNTIPEMFFTNKEKAEYFCEWLKDCFIESGYNVSAE